MVACGSEKSSSRARGNGGGVWTSSGIAAAIAL